MPANAVGFWLVGLKEVHHSLRVGQRESSKDRLVGSVPSDSAYTSDIKDKDFVQPGHQDRVIENLVGSIKGARHPELRKGVYDLFSRVNKDLGPKLQQCTEAAIKGA